ncbi:MAG: hypothetical protein HW421_1141 [Ignavibacteria bacterium]|nr:hypothetical protein [Ignavibacteria bacterium]
MKKLLRNIISKFKNPLGILYSFLFVQVIFLFCFIDLKLPVLFVYSEIVANELLKSRLSELITVFSGAIAIFAIIFSIIQLKKDYEEVIPILFSETFLFPFLGFTAGIIIDLILANSLFLANCVKGDIFIRITVLSIYSIILEMFFLIFILYRIFKLLTTDFLFDKFLELINFVAFETKKEFQHDYLFKLKKRMIDRFFQSILEDDKILIKKITNLLTNILNKQPNSFFTNDISRNIYLIFEQSVNQGNRQACYNSFNIIADFWNYGIENKNPQLINQLISHPSYFIDLIETKDFYKKELSEYLLLRLSEVYSYTLKFGYREKNEISDLKEFNNFSQLIIFSINQALKKILERKDLSLWNYGINTLIQLGGVDIESTKEYELRFKLSDLQKDILQNSNEIELLKEEIEQKEKVKRTLYLAKFGLYSWSLDLYIRNIFSLNEFEEFSKAVDVTLGNMNEAIDVLLYLVKIDFEQDNLGWTRWTFPPEDILPGKSYWVPSTSSWLVLGFVIKLIMENSLKDNFQTIINSIEDSEQFDFLDDNIKSSIEFIRKEFDTKFTFILGLSIDETEIRFSSVESFFKSLKENHNQIKEKAIALSPLSQSKIDNFKSQMLKQWKESQFVEVLFRHFDLILIPDLEVELKRSIAYVKLENCKRMFIDENYQEIFGINFGLEVSRTVDNSFFIELFKHAKFAKNLTKLSEAIDDSINDIRNRNFIPNLILIDSMLLYKEEGFYQKLKYPNGYNKFIGNVSESYYDEILILPLHNHFMTNKVIVADFSSSFEMLQRNDPIWLDSILKVEVTEFTKEKAQEELLTNKDKYSQIENFDEEKELIKIMNGIIVEVSETLDFKVKNNDSFEIIHIEIN